MKAPGDKTTAESDPSTGLPGVRPQATLLLYYADDVRAVPLPLGRPLVLGRSAPSDVVVEDPTFGEAMEAMYLEDLANATEIVPGWQSRRRQAKNMRSRRTRRHKRGGVRRIAAGALALSGSIGKAVGSRSLTATEASSVAIIGFALLALAVLITLFPVLVVSPIVIGLAIASGAMFALQVNSNFFWMFKALLGLSTKGTLKTLTMATSVASVVSLPMVVVVSLFA